MQTTTTLTCRWCGATYDAETRRPSLAGPDGQRHPSIYCSGDCAGQAYDDAHDDE